MGDLFSVLSLAHFGLSLCIHVFVYIKRNTAATLGKSQLFLTLLGTMHNIFPFEFCFLLCFYLKQLVYSCCSHFAKYARPS